MDKVSWGYKKKIINLPGMKNLGKMSQRRPLSWAFPTRNRSIQSSWLTFEYFIFHKVISYKWMLFQYTHTVNNTKDRMDSRNSVWEMELLAQVYSVGKEQSWEFNSGLLSPRSGNYLSWLPWGDLEAISKTERKITWEKGGGSGISELAFLTSSQKWAVLIASQLLSSRGLKSATVGIFTLQKLENTTNEVFSPSIASFLAHHGKDRSRYSGHKL